MVEGMADEDNAMHIEYPFSDSMLQIRIPEESKGTNDKVFMETSL